MYVLLCLQLMHSFLLYNKGGNICRADEFLCNNSLCKLYFWVCDGQDDCGDNSDEAPDMCGIVFLWLSIILSSPDLGHWTQSMK